MNAKAILDWATKILTAANKNVNAAYLALHYIDTDANLYLSGKSLSAQQQKLYQQAIRTYCKQDVPLAFFFGYTFFYNLKFYISQGCFLPRFETEQLVDELIDYLQDLNIYPKQVLDLCCGIGVIGIAIKKHFPFASVTSIDHNQEALAMAKRTMDDLNLHLELIHISLEDFIPKEKYDLIIMNPPYINKNDYVEQSVLKNDPHDALFAKNGGYYFYKVLAAKIATFAKQDFIIALEIGSNQSNQILNIFKNKIIIIDKQIIKDYQGFPRIMIIRGKLK